MTIDLRELRINRGLSLREAAKQMDVEHRALMRAEAGDTVPHPRNAFKIASFYGYRVTDLWPLEREPAA